MIALAASIQPSARSNLASFGMAATIFSVVMGWPMTPVEAMNTSLRLHDIV